MRRAVFLDRDGTLIEESGYLDRLERLVFFPYSIDAVRVLNRAGFLVVVVTNQAGIARGIVKESFVAEAHQYIADRVKAGGARLDGFYYCPHHPAGTVEPYRTACDCRKPQPGLLRRAAADLDIDLERSFVVGDRWHDVEAGHAVGARGVLVRTGLGKRDERQAEAAMALQSGSGHAPTIVDNLMDAAAWILEQPVDRAQGRP